MKKLLPIFLLIVCSLGARLMAQDTNGVIALPPAYMATNTGDFGTLDLNTGAFSLRGNSGSVLAGLALWNSTLYGAPYNSGSGFYTVNPANGSLTLVGNSAISFDDFGSTTAGLFAVSTSSILYSINPATGASTMIGPTGVSLTGFRALSSNGNALYFTSGTNLYTLNTSTGAASLVGSTGSAGIGAMTFVNGVFIGGQDSPNIRIDYLNSSNGSVTNGPLVTGTTGQFYGLAPVPEPATWMVLLLGAVVILVMQRMARRGRA